MLISPYWDDRLMLEDNEKPHILAIGDSWFWYLGQGNADQRGVGERTPSQAAGIQQDRPLVLGTRVRGGGAWIVTRIGNGRHKKKAKGEDR